MSQVETHDVIGEMEPGACWGTWSVSDIACSKCVINKRCEEYTKSKNSGESEGKGEEFVAESSEDAVPEISPMEFLIQTLCDKYEYTTKENSTARGDYFKRNGKIAIEIITSKRNGKVKINSTKGVKLVDKINSVAEAESILKELPM
jgi:hypothetical protein